MLRCVHCSSTEHISVYPKRNYGFYICKECEKKQEAKIDNLLKENGISVQS